MLQGEKTEALNIMIKQMEEAGENVLLRHGSIRKYFKEGAEMLHGKNTDQLGVSSADPVVTRKIQIKLNNLMQATTPSKYMNLMDDVIEDATMYLAVHLLQPRIVQVCKCMKNVFVQCELWCDEILRRMARPCCTCSRHISVQALGDLAPAQRLHASPGCSRVFAPGLEISLSQCPSKQLRSTKRGEKPHIQPQVQPCPAPKPTPGCEQAATTSYLLYSTTSNQYPYMGNPTRLPSQTPSDALGTLPSPSLVSKSSTFSPMKWSGATPERAHILQKSDTETSPVVEVKDESGTSSPISFHTPLSTNESKPSLERKTDNPFWQTPTTMFAKVQILKEQQPATVDADTPRRRTTRAKSGYSTRAPIITTDQMSDWHAMMVSLMWNVQAWRDWIQENIDRALSFQFEPNASPAETEEKWATFQRRVATEALQWRQYNIFSRQLTLRLALRYRDKQIVSPTRATVKTEVYMECQREMLEIIDMFNRWTHWLTVVVKETGTLQQVEGSDVPVHETRWKYFKSKVEEYSEDWIRYNMHLKVCWEHKYRTLISEWLPSWTQPGPVWVVSAYGAVPSGAVAAGVFHGEVIWLARTTHRCNVLPAALHPSKHCCLVYADGAVHHYTKYQVMCNAEVKWMAWRAGAIGARAIRIAPGVHAGRVLYRGSHLLGAVHAPHYRCHVIIFGRPFAFDCYELLVLAGDDHV